MITRLASSAVTQGLPKYRSMLAGIPLPGYESIATATPNGTGTVTFSSIPQTYQHLQIRCWMYDGANGEFNIRWDTTGTKAWHRLIGNGAAVTVTSGVSQTYLIPIAPPVSFNANIGTVAIIDIHDYSSTTKGKTLRAFAGFDNNAGNTSSIVNLGSGMSNDTTAISSITIVDSGGNFASPTSIALYGIRGA